MSELCRVCGNTVRFIFKAKVLRKYDVSYFSCPNCSFLQTEKPFWLHEAYSSSINLVDTGLTRRNILASKSVATVIFFLFNRQGKFLDYAGGYGMFARLMRDIGYNFFTHDPYTPNILAKGFDYNNADNIEILTTFESFEHFTEPTIEIEKILSICRNVFFSTQLLPNPIPKANEWWYYGHEHGQHIAFYSSRTLKYIASRHNLNLYSLKSYHIFTYHQINPLFFKFLVGAGRFGLSLIPRLLIKSRTEQDRDLLTIQRELPIPTNLVK